MGARAPSANVENFAPAHVRLAARARRKERARQCKVGAKCGASCRMHKAAPARVQLGGARATLGPVGSISLGPGQLARARQDARMQIKRNDLLDQIQIKRRAPPSGAIFGARPPPFLCAPPPGAPEQQQEARALAFASISISISISFSFLIQARARARALSRIGARNSNQLARSQFYSYAHSTVKISTLICVLAPTPLAPRSPNARAHHHLTN